MLHFVLHGAFLLFCCAAINGSIVDLTQGWSCELVQRLTAKGFQTGGVIYFKQVGWYITVRSALLMGHVTWLLPIF